MPKVSVIIPIYGVEKYIERCARSLFEQTLDDMEYIFVDDCTPDKSIEILEQVLEEYPSRQSQTRIIRLNQNGGLPNARKTGLQKATGEYIIHCDSDDWMDHDMYRIMYEKAVIEDADMVVCDYVVTDGMNHNLTIVGCHSDERNRFIENMLLQKDQWNLWNKLIKRLIYSSNVIVCPLGAMGEDMATVLQLTWFCNHITYINKPFYYYYQNPKSITREFNKNKALNNYCSLYRNVRIILDFYKEKDISIKLRFLLDWIYFRSANVLISHINTYYTEYINHFRNQNLKFITNPYIPISRKIRHFLVIIRVYR